jgi:hypothetical protein
LKTALYRHFDAQGVLLYVGISLSAVHRLEQHKRSAGWFGEIARVDVEWHETRAEALTAEAIAIAKEEPSWNVARPSTHRQKLTQSTYAIEHVASTRRDGNYQREVALEMLAWWRSEFQKDEFRLVSAPRGRVGGATGYHGVLRANDAARWSAGSQ